VHFSLVLLLSYDVFLHKLVALHVLGVAMRVADVTANTVATTRPTNTHRVAHAQAIHSLNTVATFTRYYWLGLQLTHWDAREIAANRLFHFHGLVNNVSLFHG
jgi:hypothetical protein